MELYKQFAPKGLVFNVKSIYYKLDVPMGLKSSVRSEMFVEKRKNVVIKAPSGRPVCFGEINQTIMIKN